MAILNAPKESNQNDLIEVVDPSPIGNALAQSGLLGHDHVVFTSGPKAPPSKACGMNLKPKKEKGHHIPKET